MSADGDEMKALVIDECDDKMKKAVAHVQAEFAALRTGRASSGLVEKLRVDAYGSDVPLQQLAGFGVPEPRVLTISPYDKGTIKAIEKAIQQSDLGVNPSNDGVIIRVIFPELSEERRREYIKIARHKAEDGRVAIRNIRRNTKDSLDKLIKGGDAGEDEVRRAERELDELTHTYVGQVDELLKNKEAELLEV